MKIIKNIIFGLLICISLVMVISIINKVVLRNDFLFGYKLSIVLSGSMEPNINIDDLVLIHKTDKYDKGDIVSFKNNNGETLHRIVEINDLNIITKGDNNNTNDEPIKKDDITGKYICTIPFVGNIIGYSKTPLGLILFSLIVLGLVIFIIKKK